MGAQYTRRAAASLGLLLAALSWLPLAARATENETFGLTPFPETLNGVTRRTFAIPLDVGSVYSDAVRVYNRTDNAMNLEVYASDARAAIDGTISVGSRGSVLSGVGSWIELSRDTVSLPPRGSSVIDFRVDVRTTRPAPDIGAIVAENTASNIRTGVSRRLYIVVRTTPPGSPTSSTLVRKFSLRSVWTIVAVVGLLVAGALVWLVRRRGRRSRDDVDVSASSVDEDDTPKASRPVLHRFGRADTDPKIVSLGADAQQRERPRRPERRRPIERDDRPLLDEVAFIDEDEFEDEDETDEVELPEPRPVRQQRRAATPRKPPPRKAAPRKPPADDKLDYIPLDDL
jgi:hypothetical protein